MFADSSCVGGLELPHVAARKLMCTGLKQRCLDFRVWGEHSIALFRFGQHMRLHAAILWFYKFSRRCFVRQHKWLPEKCCNWRLDVICWTIFKDSLCSVQFRTKLLGHGVQNTFRSFFLTNSQTATIRLSRTYFMPWLPPIHPGHLHIDRDLTILQHLTQTQPWP